MRVVHFDDSYFPILDGVAVVIDNYTKLLIEKGHESFVVTIDNKEANDNFGYQVLRFKSGWDPFNKVYETPLVAIDFKMKKRLMKEPIDIIHIHTPFMVGHYAIRLAKKRKIPTVVTFHTQFYDDLLEALRFKFLAKLAVKYILNVYQKADHVIAVSEYAKTLLYEYGYKGEIKVIPNGVDFKRPDNKAERNKEIRNEFKIKDEEELFLFVGQHNFKKNIKLIYEALAIYKKKQPNFKLLMIGHGSHEKELKKYARQLGIKNNVIFVGKVYNRDKLASFFAASDLFLFPSVYDTFSLVVREAAICETPSVVVDGYGAAEGIKHNVNGFLCENNKESLALEIANAMSDKKNLAKVGKEAARTIPLSWDTIVNEVSSFYKEILNKND